MVIQTIGVDIEKVSRFSRKKFEKNIKFYQKIFSKDEINYCLSKANPYPHFTTRFCAKEAAIKALKNRELKLSDIEIIMKNGTPYLQLPIKRKSLVSLSHTNEFAIAVVVMSE